MLRSQAWISCRGLQCKCCGRPTCQPCGTIQHLQADICQLGMDQRKVSWASVALPRQLLSCTAGS